LDGNGLLLNCELFLASGLASSTSTNRDPKLVDYETEATKGEFHHNSIRIGDRFLKTHVPGLGGEYLEFHCHPSAHPAEFVGAFYVVTVSMPLRHPF
jgi:hypothetical protein